MRERCRGGAAIGIHSNNSSIVQLKGDGEQALTCLKKTKQGSMTMTTKTLIEQRSSERIHESDWDDPDLVLMLG